MEISDGRAAYRPLNLEKVLQTPGARLELDNRGDIVVRMPKQTRSVGLRLLAAFSRLPQLVADRRRQKTAARFELTQDQGFYRMQPRRHEVASSREQAINFLVAEAFVRRQQLEKQPEVTSRIRERLVQLPHELFANQLAQLARELGSKAGSTPAAVGGPPGKGAVSRATEARRMVEVVKLAQQLQKDGLAADASLVNRLMHVVTVTGADARTFGNALADMRLTMAEVARARPQALQSAHAGLERALSVLRRTCAEIRNNLPTQTPATRNDRAVPGPELRVALADDAAKSIHASYGGDSAVDLETLQSVLRIASRTPDILKSVPDSAVRVLQRQQQAAGRSLDDLRPGDALGALIPALLGQSSSVATRPMQDAVLRRTLGATLTIGADGEFQVCTPAELQADRRGDGEQRLRQALSQRYTLTSKSGQHRYALRAEPDMWERATNQRLNGPVAEAFISQLKALGSRASPVHRARIAAIREEMTSRPPELFASQLASLSDAMWSVSSLHQRDLDTVSRGLRAGLLQLPRGAERDLLVQPDGEGQGEQLTPAAEQLVRRAIDRWQDDVVARMVANGLDVPEGEALPFLNEELRALSVKSS